MLTMQARACPVCGSTGESRVFAPANLDLENLNAFSFASRKLPEYMHAALVECPSCDVVYANPAIEAESLALRAFLRSVSMDATLHRTSDASSGGGAHASQ